MITLKLTNGNWMATFNGDAEIMRLFGTDTLPTPYTSKTSAEIVLAAIRSKNPGVNVVLA